MSITAETLTTQSSSNQAPVASTKTWSLRRTTVAVGAGAAVITAAAAAVVHAAGVPLAVDGEMIPIAGFAQVTFVCAVIGGVMVALFNRFSSDAHRRFVQTAVVLTALSCVPSATLPPDAATKVSLVALHLLAAVIIIPVLARHAD